MGKRRTLYWQMEPIIAALKNANDEWMSIGQIQADANVGRFSRYTKHAIELLVQQGKIEYRLDGKRPLYRWRKQTTRKRRDQAAAQL